ncbi:30S ribosomal protein S5 [Candidatus Berkelbacteria bacterium]|nr:30S ribosomal protein S5 [Candidatus Berkelbacteria bacterium]
MAREHRPSQPKEKKEFEERVVAVDRVSRTVKGGKRMRFRALVVIGNRAGKVGMGIGKAGDVQGAIAKAVSQAKKHLIVVPIVNETIPHEATTKFGAATVFLKPAPTGTSIIAGGPVRAVIELAGIHNILSKIIGSTNQINNVTATLQTLARLRLGAHQTQAPVESALKPTASITEESV